MSKWKLISGVALVLIVGILLGSVVTRLYLKQQYVPFDPRERTSFVMKKLSKELNLTPEQKNRVEKIVEQTAEQIHQHFVQIRPEVQRIIDESFSEIRNQLNDDQKAKLDVLKEKFTKHRQATKR